MADISFTTVPGRIKPLLKKIKDVGIPDSVSQVWLQSIGFTSSNDRSLINVLKLAGLVNGSKVPTDRWKQYRGSAGAKVLAEGLREGYADIYKVYPDAHQRSNAELENVISTGTKAGKQSISKMVATFKALVAEADFDDLGEVSDAAPGPLHAPIADKAMKPTTAKGAGVGPSLHIDMQVHISPEATPEQIDQIFSSMAKHLYGVK